MKILERHPRIRWIVLAIVVVLLIVRLVLPSITLRKFNNSLAHLDGPFCGHIDHLHLAIWRGAYELNKFELKKRDAKTNDCKENLLSVERVQISAAWGAIIKGKARLRVDFYAPEIAVDPLIEALETGDKRAEAAKGAQKTWDVLVPWRIDGLGIQEGKAYFILFGQGGISAPLEQVQGEVTGIESSIASALPILFHIKGSVFGSSPMVVAGSAALGPGPTRWEADFSAEHVEITKANPFLYNRLPLTFTTGNLDIYGEAAGKGGDMEGYTRLIFTNIDVVSEKERWKNFKQGILEVVSSLFFVVSKNIRTHNAGTEIIFHKKGQALDVNWGSALARSLQHSRGNLVPHGVSNTLGLPSP